MPYDVRALANLILDLADARGKVMTNLSVNKIAYFLHANYLVAFDRPLTTAKIEAWKFGPVFRELYAAFKVFGDGPIAGRASRMNPGSGQIEICSATFTPEDRPFLEEVASKYINIEVGSLVSIPPVRWSLGPSVLLRSGCRHSGLLRFKRWRVPLALQRPLSKHGILHCVG